MTEEINQQDESFWKETVKDVQKMNKSSVAEKPTPKFVKKHTSVAEYAVVKNYKHMPDFETSSDIDKQTLRRFKREEFGVEVTLDLHGKTENEAFEAVHHFITQAYLSSKRAVLIVTGKGNFHQDEDPFTVRGVLKERVPMWLKDDDLRGLILTYIHPSQKLGGQGAIYILLRRNR